MGSEMCIRDRFKPVRYYSTEESFPAQHSASSSDEELAVPSRPASSAASEVERAAVPNVFPDLPVDRANVDPDGTMTRRRARDLGVHIPQIPLPDKCWSSSTYRK